MSEARLLREIVIEDADRVGVIADVSRVLCDMGIDLESVLVRVEADRARMHLITSSQTYARDALRDAGFSVEERDVVTVEMPHHPGFLCRIVEAMARRDITLYELYATASSSGTAALVVFTCSNNLHALQLLRGK
jgi:hypothetical protein